MAKEVLITAKVPENKEKGTKEMNGQVTVNYGNTAAECVELFGDEAVRTNALRNWVVTVQGNIRSALKKGTPADKLQALLGGAKMGVAQVGAAVDPIEAYTAMWASATPEKQKEMLEDLRKDAANK